MSIELLDEGEKWRPIPGTGGAYDVSNQGRVRSWKRWRGHAAELPRLMRVQDIGGRPWIQLGLRGPTHRIDRLLAEVWGIAPAADSPSEAWRQMTLSPKSHAELVRVLKDAARRGDEPARRLLRQAETAKKIETQG